MKGRYYLAIVILILSLPIALYSYKFGFGLWNSNHEWAQMGSAFGGLYAPILSILTLFVLVKQFQIQKQMHEHEHRATSREISFNMVEKFTIKIESMFTQEVVDDLICLSKLSRGSPEAEILKRRYLDIFTLWATVHATLKNYEKQEPRMIVDLASIAVLHLTFNMCATLEEAYVVHMCGKDEECFKYWFMKDA
ncbi:hypothetical protein AVO42_08115 [Thiomicrospira sp. XS5]|uniref:hypothetical protein n=1 Tax=Thiomicrospira sp. XS5 TaxID=1775636 RepID=UPI000746E425|nr:hypothetical protein [Thiomicrospira sp. XS5]KUJ75288.1 hypothetical protein AVO42_08115 [Thiomicrospira sp. XS5]